MQLSDFSKEQLEYLCEIFYRLLERKVEVHINNPLATQPFIFPAPVPGTTVPYVPPPIGVWNGTTSQQTAQNQ
jgi:hypothetical protein